MPRGDGTGPMGIGPMTGRRAGKCVGYASSESPNQGVGFGRGGSRGLRRMSRLTNASLMSNTQVMDEKAELKNQEDFLEKQLQQVKDRLKVFDEQK